MRRKIRVERKITRPFGKTWDIREAYNTKSKTNLNDIKYLSILWVD